MHITLRKYRNTKRKKQFPRPMITKVNINIFYACMFCFTCVGMCEDLFTKLESSNNTALHSALPNLIFCYRYILPQNIFWKWFLEVFF